MFRTRPLQTWFAQLAMVATLLMVCAPLVSRWLSAGDVTPAAADYAELCTAEGLKRVALALPAAESMPHPSDRQGASHGGHGMAFGASHDSPAERLKPDAGHAGHGEAACDYCLLAMRVLPALLCLLAMFLLPRAATAAFAHAPRFALAFAWPAHPARGPPLYA